MQLRLAKLEGAGNDFVVADGRWGEFPPGDEAGPLIRALCDRRRGIGADGVIVLRRPNGSGARIRMEYFNADGGEAAMCGNGARCFAAHASRVAALGPSFAFETAAGLHSAEIDPDGIVRISFPDVVGLPRQESLDAAGQRWDVDFLVVGVPHAVAWVEDAGAVDVATAGRALRWHEAFSPEGANASFAQVLEPGRLLLRTFERGVEGETLACGTGAVAAAAAHARRLGAKGAFECRLVPTGGDELLVRFHAGPKVLAGVQLGGPARHVFSFAVRWDGATGQLFPL